MVLERDFSLPKNTHQVHHGDNNIYIKNTCRTIQNTRVVLLNKVTRIIKLPVQLTIMLIA